LEEYTLLMVKESEDALRNSMNEGLGGVNKRLEELVAKHLEKAELIGESADCPFKTLLDYCTSLCHDLGSKQHRLSGAVTRTNELLKDF